MASGDYCCAQLSELPEPNFAGLYLTCKRGCHVVSVRTSRFLKPVPGTSYVWLINKTGKYRKQHDISKKPKERKQNM
jgi:hypothetical protein